MTSHTARSAGRHVSNRTTATRESSVQPERRRTFRADLRKPGLLHPPPSTATLPQPAPFHTRHQTVARTFRVRVGAEDRNYRRAVRTAEMTAWNAAPPSDARLLRAEKTKRRSRAEELAFNLILALAFAGVIWGLADSASLANGLQSVVSFMREWIG